jgi:dipeptidyl-peptidase 4
MTQVSYPRLSARTQRFTLGRPRSFRVRPDGSLVLFVRSASGTDKVGRLWALDTKTGVERELVNPAALANDAGTESLSDQERARRERMREQASGIVAYSTNSDLSTVCFSLAGHLYTTDVLSGATKRLTTPTPAIDPHLDPDGQWVAFSANGGLHIAAIDDSVHRSVATPESEHVSWGLAEFIANEELGRSRGFWWSPDGGQLIVERYDDSQVSTWYVSDPTHPDRPDKPQRYPAAGTPNAEVSMWLVSLDGTNTRIEWDQGQWEYVSSVHWSDRGDPLVQLLDRRQQNLAVLAVDPGSGATTVVRQISNEHWVDVFPGSPTWGPAGELMTIEVVADRYALCADGSPISPAEVNVRGIVDVGPDDVMFVGDQTPLEQQLWRWGPQGVEQLTTTAGLHSAVRGAGTLVTVTATLESPTVAARWSSPTSSGLVRSVATEPPFEPNVTLLAAADDQPRVAVILPQEPPDHDSLPVLMDPYGGPHGQQVRSAQGLYRESQWFADQGFAVVVVDGRGTPGSPAWERAVAGDFVTAVLADQVKGLTSAADAFPVLDLSRVAIRGWSFGGYLAALAVLDLPEVFHAGIAGAPVTDFALYDTAYTERYLGTPEESPDAYEKSSLLTRAHSLSRPLQIIHGFADDNVFMAHSLQLSKVLTEHGRPHELLPLTGITHMTSNEEVAENLLLLQVDFLRRALGLEKP